MLDNDSYRLKTSTDTVLVATERSDDEGQSICNIFYMTITYRDSGEIYSLLIDS